VPVTIRDIAHHLGISHSTVSRAFRGSPHVSEGLRQRIFDTARELNYRPNASARRLKDTRTGLVGLIIPDLRNDFYASTATLIQQALAAEGYRLLLTMSCNDPIIEAGYLRSMLEERVEGLIIVPSSLGDQTIRDYDEAGVPLVQFVRLASDRLDAVLLEDSEAARGATDHLLQLGHRRIALILGQSHFSSSSDRLSGYRKALEVAAVREDETLIKIGGYNRAWGFAATQSLLELSSPPTAIVATSNELMVGVLRALGERQVAIPEDISLVGFGDADWCVAWRPPLTTVEYGVEEAAAMVVRILIQRLREHSQDGSSHPVHRRVPCRLMIRQSTGN